MDIFEVLTNDHRKAAELLAKLVDSSEGAVKTRESTFATLKQELDDHTTVEEQVFYSVLKGEKKTRRDTLEALEEHHVVDILLKELEGTDKGSEEWTAKLTVLKELIEHHVEEEEEELFPEARKLLTGDRAEEMGRKAEEAKKKLH